MGLGRGTGRRDAAGELTSRVPAIGATASRSRGMGSPDAYVDIDGDTIIVGAAFAFFAATIRIRVNAPQQWVERKASIIHLPADGEGLRHYTVTVDESGTVVVDLRTPPG